MNENLKVSDYGLKFITNEEGVVLHIYQDQLGLDTIGIGHLLTQDDKITGRFANGISMDQALALLKRDIVGTENTVKRYIQVELNQNQFDSLVSMIFNTGPKPIVPGPPGTGTLGKLINQGLFASVPEEMAKWCRGSGKILPVLQKRRLREGNLFQKPILTDAATVKTTAEAINIIHPDIVLPVIDHNDPEQDQEIKLSSWQRIQNGIFKIFR